MLRTAQATGIQRIQRSTARAERWLALEEDADTKSHPRILEAAETFTGPLEAAETFTGQEVFPAPRISKKG